MPSAHTGGRDREQFPSLQEDIGEDPARWLDRELVGGSSRAKDNKRFVAARVRGIDKLPVLRAWMAVERALGRGPNDGPREGLMRLLEQRENFLQQAGERPDRLQHGPRRPPGWFDSESAVELDQRSADEHLTTRRVATDGGESHD